MTLYRAPDDQFLVMVRDRGFDGTDDELLAIKRSTLAGLQSGKFVVQRDPSSTLLFAGVSMEVVAPILFNMHWTLLRTPADSEFVISDNPVTLFSASMVGNSLYGFGFGQHDVEVRTPLTRECVLLQTHLQPDFDELTCSAENMVNINHLTWWSADDYVFGSSEAVLRRVAAIFGSDADRRYRGPLPTHPPHHHPPTSFVKEAAGSRRTHAAHPVLLVVVSRCRRRADPKPVRPRGVGHDLRATPCEPWVGAQRVGIGGQGSGSCGRAQIRALRACM
jgi:hypothetical protein